MKISLEANTSLASWYPKKYNPGGIERRDALGNPVTTPSQIFSTDFDESRGDFSLQSKVLVDSSTTIVQTTEKKRRIHVEDPILEAAKTISKSRSKPVVKLFPASVKQSLSGISKDFHLRSSSKDLFKSKHALQEPTSPTRDSTDDREKTRSNTLPTRLETRTDSNPKKEVFRLVRRESATQPPFSSNPTEASVQTLTLKRRALPTRDIHQHPKQPSSLSLAAQPSDTADFLATLPDSLYPVRHGVPVSPRPTNNEDSRNNKQHREQRQKQNKHIAAKIRMKQTLSKEVGGVLGARLGVGFVEGGLVQQLNFLSSTTGKSSYTGYVKAHETLYGLPIHISPYFRRFDKPTESNTVSSSNLQTISSMPGSELRPVHTVDQYQNLVRNENPYQHALKHYRWSSATLEDLPLHSTSSLRPNPHRDSSPSQLIISSDTAAPQTATTAANKTAATTNISTNTQVPVLQLLADLDPQLALLRRSVVSARRTFTKQYNAAAGVGGKQGLLKRLSQGNRFNPVESIGKITGQIQESTINILAKKQSVSKVSPESLNTSKSLDNLREVSPRVKISGGSIAELVSVIGGMGQSFVSRRLPESLKALPESTATKATDFSDSKPYTKSVVVVDLNAGLVGTKIHKPLFSRLKIQPNSPTEFHSKPNSSNGSNHRLPGVSRLSSQYIGPRITSFSPIN